MKLVLKIASIGALGLLLLFVALSLALNPLLGKALRGGVTRATGTPTTLASVDLGLVSGRLDLAGFAIANPEGFADQPFLALERGRVEVDVASLLGDAVLVRSIELSGVNLNIEAHGLDTNYAAILEHMRGSADGSEGPDAPSDGSRKTLTVESIVVTDIRCELDLDVPLAEGKRAITIPKLVLEDFHSDGSTAENVAKLTRALVEGLLQAVLEGGGGLLPEQLRGDLEDRLGELRAALEEKLGDIDIERTVEEVGDAVRDLFGKDKR